MSRSGYSDDCENDWALIRWRGAVASAIRGRRGQAFLREMLSALGALESKRLITDDLVREGEVCALGSVAIARGMNVNELDPYDHPRVAEAFGIPHSLACEIMYENDGTEWSNDTPEARYERVRRWVKGHIRDDGDAELASWVLSP